jgi:hypothetical protein
MNIYARRGAKVRFLDRNGYDYQLETARRLLSKDGVYTVDRTDVHSWYTYVYLIEFPGEAFNSAMFVDDAKEAPNHDDNA